MIKMRYNLGHLFDDLILAGTVVAGVTVGEVVKDKVPHANFPVDINGTKYTLNGAELGGGALSIAVAPMIGKFHKYLAGFGSGLIADGLLPLEQAVNTVKMQVATPPQDLGWAQNTEWAQNVETVGMRKTAEEYGWAQTQEEPKVVKAFSQEDLIKAYGWA